MYKLYVFFTVAFFAISCNNYPNNDGSLNSESAQLKKKKELLSFIHGGWVRRDLAKKLIIEKSVFKAFNEELHFIELIIDTSGTGLGDTIGNPGCLENDSEMNYFKIVLQHSDSSLKMKPLFIEGSLREAKFHLNYKIRSDSILILTVEGESPLNKEIEYIKVFSNPPNKDYQVNPIDFMIMKNFFGKKLQAFDKENKFVQDSVFFTNFETCNFLNFNLYNVSLDFGFGYPKFDQINFYKDVEKKSFHWKILDEEIHLYSLHPSINSPGIQGENMGTLRYKLIQNRQ